MSKFYSLLTFLCSIVSCLQTNAQTTCRADFEKLPSTATDSSATGFHAIPWESQEKKPEEICWNFGDNHDTCIKYDPALSNNYFVSHSYTHGGTYNVCIRIQYQGGCVSEKCKLVQIGAPDSCGVTFETLTSSANAVGKYFIAQPWHNYNKRPVFVCWNFGDNHDTCIQYSTDHADAYSVFHPYAHADNYNVCVKMVYDGGCESHYCQVVRVGELTDSCTADFESGPTSSTSLNLHFAALPGSHENKRPVYICWNFGDNHDTCIQYSNTNAGPYGVNHNYAEHGRYEVCVRIVYDGGCEAKKCKVIQIGQVDGCRADFERIPVASGNDASLTYYRALPANADGKKPEHICWSFGDGKDSCVSYSEDYSGPYTIGHHYEHSGMYEACVKIVYRDGCDARKCKVINIFRYTTDTCRVHMYEIVRSVTGLTRAFYFASLTNNRPVRICWNFGDGTDTCITPEPNATEIPHIIRHAYPAPGIYRVCVKVFFPNGCAASDCIEVGIRSLTDLCGGYFTDSLIDSHAYLFKAFSIHRPDDNVISYRWNFGDGNSGIGEIADHKYHEPGIYRVCLLMRTEKGCETKICNNVRVAGSPQTRLQLTPNPVVNILHALFYSRYNEEVKIKIINSNGVVIKEYSQIAVVGLNAWEFDLAGLLPGVYSFVVQSPNQFASSIFFKQ